ncbi:MAG TPA: choice-of-anchor D domain-containing protein, partial [Symbiobacteriaceae bacterium]|nr:choice-of-anchor D domain-containing protein [Symbiobacteriaceae bacterium]
MGTTLPHGDIRATVQGRNYGQIVVGNGNQVLSILVGHGGVLSLQQQPAPPVSEPRPQPVDMRPRRIHSLPGWEPEARQAVTALERGLLVELWGADEPARTAILRFLAYQPVAERFAAGVAYLDGAAHTDDDLLQALHQVFYRTQPPTRLDEIEIRHLLRRQQALLLLDRAELEDRALDRVLNAAPEATFVLASARSHGRAELCSVALRDEQAPLPGLPARLAQASQGARSILSAMSILGGIAVSARHLAAIVSLPDFITALEEVLQAGLVFQNDLYSLAPGVAEAAAETWDLSPWRAAAAAHFTAWIEENRDAPDVLLSQLSLLLHLMRTLGESGQWVHALHLGKALEPVVALSGRWGVWQHLLERLQPAAEAAGDRQMTAYVLHQLGTRLLCLGKDGARTLLEQALAIWQVLGDEAGAAVTSANLAQLAPSHAAAQDTQPPELTPPGRGLWRGIIGGIAALAMVGAAAWVVLNWPLWPPPPPSAQVEPARLDFDPVQAGGSPVQAKLLLHNTGDAPFPVKGVRLTGNEAAQFHIEDDGCTNTKVDPASACAVVVSFSPAVPGGATAQVEFAVAGI